MKKKKIEVQEFKNERPSFDSLERSWKNYKTIISSFLSTPLRSVNLEKEVKSLPR